MDNNTSPPKKNRLSVLVLDDSDLVTDLVTFSFRNQKISVTGTTKGEEALRLLEQQPFDLVITDLRMPGMSGIEFLTAVRASPVFGKIPVIALSGYEEQSYQDEAKLAGADAYLQKPFTPEKLQACVRKLLTGRS